MDMTWLSINQYGAYRVTVVISTVHILNERYFSVDKIKWKPRRLSILFISRTKTLINNKMSLVLCRSLWDDYLSGFLFTTGENDKQQYWRIMIYYNYLKKNVSTVHKTYRFRQLRVRDLIWFILFWTSYSKNINNSLYLTFIRLVSTNKTSSDDF